jgi:lauroyl/myristoyl acyltransferase
VTPMLGKAGIRLPGRVRSGIGFARSLLGHAVLAFVMLFLLRPAAAALPCARAMAVARFLGHVHARTPGYGLARVKQMGESFGVEDRVAAKLAARRSSRLLCDSVAVRRALRGAADMDRRRIVEVKSDSIDRVLQSGESFILATGHFSREAFLALSHFDVLPHAILSVSLPPTAIGLHPRTWWLSYHYGQILECSRALRPEIEFVYPDRSSAYRHLVEALRARNRVVLIHADAPVTAGGATYSRPFAGQSLRRFSLAPARLSRSTRRPIVVCLPRLKDDQTIVLNWTRAIEPGDVDDAGTDQRIMDQILDDIERAVGLYPDQYLVDVLGTRRWDASAERWVM